MIDARCWRRLTRLQTPVIIAIPIRFGAHGTDATSIRRQADQKPKVHGLPVRDVSDGIAHEPLLATLAPLR
jgi:hypothetical protein